MKKFLSCFLSLIFLTNFTLISCAFDKNDSSVKIEKTESNAEYKKKIEKLSDEELKNKIINLMETGKINIPHKTVLDVLHQILGIPVFLLKAALISAISLLSAASITALGLYILTLRKLNNITKDLKDTSFNINVSDGAACTIITTLLIPFYKIFQIPLPNEEKYIDFCFNKLNKQSSPNE